MMAISCGKSADSPSVNAAVDLGLDYMTYLVMKRFQLITDDVAISELGRIRENALDLRMQRLQEQADPVLYDEDFD
jgi:hypothetical protein